MRGKLTNYKGAIIPMFDTLKNSLTGKLHHPHAHFIDYGSHAITIRTSGKDTMEETQRI